MPVHVHLGASDILGRVALLEGELLSPGEAMLAELILEKPVGALWGDHFILRDQSATRTLGGGRVLDIFPPSRHKRAAERLEYLRLLDQADRQPALANMPSRARSPALNLDRYALNRNLAAEEAQEAVAQTWASSSSMRRAAASGFSPANWQALRQRLLEAARAEHARAPDMIGVERDRLRRLALPTLSRAVFDKLTFELLSSNELAQSGSWLHLPEHRAALAATDADLWRTLEARCWRPSPAARRACATSRSATGIAEEIVRGLMKRVARVGQVYPVAHDHYFAAEAVADLAGRIARLCERDGTARAAALRDEIGGGRKVAIHILEFFDRVGYTRRVRDEHALRGGERAKGQWVL
jgi:selenocysteine-specific elongation factor